MREPIDWAQWGKAMREIREKKPLTRAELARRTGVAESTLRNVESGRHKPTKSILRAICLELQQPNPIASAETLSLPIGGLDRERAIGLLKAALGAFVHARSDEKAFSELLVPAPGIERFEAECQAADDRQDAAEMLAAIVEEERNREP